VHYDWIEENYPCYCSIRAIRYSVPNLESYSLKYLLNHYDIASEVFHVAEQDTKYLYDLLELIKPEKWIRLGERIERNTQKKSARKLKDIDLNVDTTEKLSGEVICFTGKSDYSRSIMQEIVIKNGAEVTNGITNKTTILIVGLDAGSKLDKALEKGISIISDNEFMELLSLQDRNIL
jgi:NAD-dependent DNA ligase